MAEVLKRDLWRAGPGVFALSAEAPRRQAAWHPFALALYKQDSNRSPAWLFPAFVEGCFDAIADGFAHAWHRKQVKSLLNRVPVLLRDQHRIRARTGNQNRLVRLGSLVKKTVKLFTRLGCVQAVHASQCMLFRTLPQAGSPASLYFKRATHGSGIKTGLNEIARGVAFRPQNDYNDYYDHPGG